MSKEFLSESGPKSRCQPEKVGLAARVEEMIREARKSAPIRSDQAETTLDLLMDFASRGSRDAMRASLEVMWREAYMAGWEDRQNDEIDPLPAGAQHDTLNPYKAKP